SRDQSTIGGNQVASRQSNRVSRNDLYAGNFAPRSIAQHRGSHGDALAKPLHGPSRTVGLNEVDPGADDDDAGYDPGSDWVAYKRRYPGGTQQEENEWIDEQGHQLEPRPRVACRRRLI